MRRVLAGFARARGPTGGSASGLGASVGVRFFIPRQRGVRELAIETSSSSSKNKAPRIRVNRQIRISPVRVIAEDGAQLGVLSGDEAIAAAQERGLDLVEVAPLARPPLVKILTYGQFKFVPPTAPRPPTKNNHPIL